MQSASAMLQIIKFILCSLFSPFSSSFISFFVEIYFCVFPSLDHMHTGSNDGNAPSKQICLVILAEFLINFDHINLHAIEIPTEFFVGSSVW